MKLHIAGAYYSSTCLSTYISVVSTERIELLSEGFACIGVFSLFFFFVRYIGRTRQKDARSFQTLFVISSTRKITKCSVVVIT